MAKTYADLQLLLANRLGSNTAPTDTAELAKRRKWFWEAISMITGDEFMWFMKTLSTDTAVTGKAYYDIPTGFIHPIEIKVDGNIYKKTTKEDYDAKKQTSIVSLPSVILDYEYYIYDDKIFFSPGLTAPSALSVTLTSSGTTATATTTAAHGYAAGQFVTISGANESPYNGVFEIQTVPTTTTFTYTLASTTTSSATGTITATLKNIEIWHYIEATEPTADTDTIYIPDKYTFIPVSYAEGRYWSSAHKRGKAADGFTEFENGVLQVKRMNFRRKFGQNDATDFVPQ